MWSLDIANDADSTGERTVTAVWDDGTFAFTFSMRCSVDEKGQDKFIEKAVEARDRLKASFTQEKSFIGNVLDKLNNLDPVAKAQAEKAVT